MRKGRVGGRRGRQQRWGEEGTGRGAELSCEDGLSFEKIGDRSHRAQGLST
jgi:hypothetical protein